MGYWGHSRRYQDAWRWLLDDLKPDLALLQECVVPDWAASRVHVRFKPGYPLSPRQRWGTAVISTCGAITPARPDAVAAWLDSLGAEAQSLCSATRLDSWCVGGDIAINGNDVLRVFSIHNPAFPIDRKLLKGVDISDLKLTLNRDLWLQDVIFYFLRRELGSPLVVGGDFNTSRLLDVPKPRGNVEFFERLDKSGFCSLHRRFHDTDEQTFFHPKRRPHQLDYLYADPNTARRAVACYVVKDPVDAGLSDHAPLVADFES